MIFKLSATIEDLQLAAISELEELIQELIRASRRGRHCVVIDRVTADWIKNNVALSNIDKSQLTSIMQSYPQRASILRDARFYLDICLGPTRIEKFENNFRIGHKALLNSQYFNETVFLVENSTNDGQIYSVIFNSLRQIHVVKTIEFSIQTGGGSAISGQFESLISDKRIVVVLTDGDKAHPTAKKSDILKSIDIVAKRNTYLGYNGAIPCRDVENLLSIETIKSHNLAQNYPDRLFDHLLRIRFDINEDDLSLCPMLYFDMKNGIDIGKLNIKPENSPERRWIREKFKFEGTAALDESISGFGENLLRNFLNSGDALSTFRREVLDSRWNKKFGTVFHDILWFFACDQAKVV